MKKNLRLIFKLFVVSKRSECRPAAAGLWLALVLGAATLAYGSERLTPQEVQAALVAGENIALIDLRPQNAYDQGTLPDALRMSVREALEKKFTGKVIFFDNGLSVNHARRAADTFTKAGKAAAELAGGYAAWRAIGLATSERGGISPRLEHYVSYQDLTGALLEDADDIVLIDVRTKAPPVSAALATTAAGDDPPSAATHAPAPLDLAAEFPAYRVTRKPAAINASGQLLLAAAPEPDPVQPLHIVIDSGDGQAEKQAAQLRSAGYTRVAVLAGGEVIIRRKGEAGLLRRGPGTGLTVGQPLSNQNMATISEEISP